MITIILTNEQTKKLADILDATNDCGPKHEGWASPELESLRIIVQEEILKDVLLEISDFESSGGKKVSIIPTRFRG